MSKYAFLGLFFTVIVLIMGGLAVNHNSNTNYMQEIEVGLESAAIGVMRESDGDTYGVRAKDLQAELTAEIADKQAYTGRIIEVSFKYFDVSGNPKDYHDVMDIDTNGDGINDNGTIDFPDALDESGDLVGSVQYKVDLYKEGTTTIDEKGELAIMEGQEPQSSTENRISLNSN